MRSFRHNLRSVQAFIFALTMLASVAMITHVAAEDVETSEPTVTDTETASDDESTVDIQAINYAADAAPADGENTAGLQGGRVDDYTKLFPGLTATKLKLSDPKFTEKDWYEYIEYEFYTDVKDGDTIFRIYQPTDYSAASIMAITDYNSKEVLGGTSNLTMNLGELQGILDIAAQGGSISKEFVGLDLANGIAEQMNTINDVMDNSRYYSFPILRGFKNR